MKRREFITLLWRDGRSRRRRSGYPWPRFRDLALADDGADCYGQTSLLVGHRSSAERRWIEAARSTEPGSLVRRRYSACPVDSCGNVYSVGQPKMNWRSRLFRLWIVGSALFVIAVALICYSEIKSHA